MANEMATRVPGSNDRKLPEPLLTPEDIAIAIKRPVRWVREHLLKTGKLRCMRFSATCWRVRREDFEALVEKGAPGFRYSGKRI